MGANRDQRIEKPLPVSDSTAPSKAATSYRTLFLAAFFTQLSVVLIGTFVLYSCTRASPYITNHFWNALYWSIIGPAGLMIIGAHVALPVIAVLSVGVFSGLRWRRVRFLWPIGICLWGVWWLLLVYVMCVAPAD